MQKYILIIYGPMCAGKSTTTKLFLQKTPGIFHISVDKIKFLISDYNAEKYRGMIMQLTFDLAKSAVEKGFSLVVEGNIGLQHEGRKNYQELAKNNGYSFVEINIEAPLEILKQRFLQRVEQSKIKGSQLTITDINEMTKRYDRYIEYIKDSILTLDSLTLNSEEIVEKISEHIEKVCSN